MHRIRLQAQPGQVLAIDLDGLAPAQRHPGAPIELIGNGVQILLAIAAQISPLGEVLAQEPIGVLVAPALPGGCGGHRSTASCQCSRSAAGAGPFPGPGRRSG